MWKKRFGLDLSPLEKVKHLLAEPKDWLPVGTDGIHSSGGKYIGQYYNQMYPEFTLYYESDESPFGRGKINVVESSMYWMEKLPRPLHNAYIYELSVKYHSTVMYSILAVFADNFRFQRVLWKSRSIFRDASIATIRYSFVEQDSLDFLLDNWLCNHYETVEQIEESTYSSPIEPWNKNPEYRGFNPYDVVPVFKNSDEHRLFIEYVNSRENEFIKIIGTYSFEDSPHKDDDYIKDAYPDYIDYLCRVGKMLVDWLNEWRQSP